MSAGATKRRKVLTVQTVVVSGFGSRTAVRHLVELFGCCGAVECFRLDAAPAGARGDRTFTIRFQDDIGVKVALKLNGTALDGRLTVKRAAKDLDAGTALPPLSVPMHTAAPSTLPPTASTSDDLPTDPSTWTPLQRQLASTVHVVNLPEPLRPSELRSFFKTLGKVAAVEVESDVGFALVEFEDHTTAATLLKKGERRVFQGRLLKICRANNIIAAVDRATARKSTVTDGDYDAPYFPPAASTLAAHDTHASFASSGSAGQGIKAPFSLASKVKPTAAISAGMPAGRVSVCVSFVLQ
jgi:hypothetical protein